MTHIDGTSPHADRPAHHPHRRRLFAIAILTFVNVLWGLSFPMTKTINLQVDANFGVEAEHSSTPLRVAAASWLIGCRFLIALGIFAIFFRSVIRRAGRAEWLAGTWIGVFFVVGLILQVMALATIPASRSGFLTSLVAVYTPLISALLFRIKPPIGVALGVVVALLGVAVLTGLVIVGPGGAAIAEDALTAWTFGDTLTTLGAIFFAGQVILVDRFGRRLDAAALTPGMFASTAIFAFIAFAIARPMIPETPLVGWVELSCRSGFWVPVLALSIFCSVLAFNWMNSYQHYVSASQAGIIYTFEPVCASAAAMIMPGLLSRAFGVDYPNETLVLPMLLGGALIILANLLSLCPDPRKRRSTGGEAVG